MARLDLHKCAIPNKNLSIEEISDPQIDVNPRILRAIIKQAFPTDADFNAFCLDEFPQVYHRFSDSMDRLIKTNLLFECIDLLEILKRIKISSPCAELPNRGKALFFMRSPLTIAMMVILFAMIAITVASFSRKAQSRTSLPVSIEPILTYKTNKEQILPDKVYLGEKNILAEKFLQQAVQISVIADPDAIVRLDGIKSRHRIAQLRQIQIDSQTILHDVAKVKFSQRLTPGSYTISCQNGTDSNIIRRHFRVLPTEYSYEIDCRP